MRVTRDGHSDAARWALLRDCETFHYTEDEARAWLDAAPGQLVDAWERERAGLGFRPESAPTPALETWFNAPPPPDLAPSATRARVANGRRDQGNTAPSQKQILHAHGGAEDQEICREILHLTIKRSVPSHTSGIQVIEIIVFRRLYV